MNKKNKYNNIWILLINLNYFKFLIKILFIKQMMIKNILQINLMKIQNN